MAVVHQVVHVFAHDLVRREAQQVRAPLVDEGTIPLGIDAINAFAD